MDTGYCGMVDMRQLESAGSQFFYQSESLPAVQKMVDESDEEEEHNLIVRFCSQSNQGSGAET